MYEAVVVNTLGVKQIRILTSENVLKVLSKRDLKIVDENQNFKISTLVLPLMLIRVQKFAAISK